jgi:multisubunit Na+/H+ antiporter MnhE subunit
MRKAVAIVVAWAALLVLWQLYVGQTTTQTTIAGAIAAALAVTFWTLLGRLGLLRYRLRAGGLAQAATLPWYLVRDFGIVTLALLRRRPEGRLVELELPAGSAGDRALAGLLGSVAPNAYLVDFDTHRRRALVHELDPARSKGALP